MRVIQGTQSEDVLPLLLEPSDFSTGTGGRIPANDPRLPLLLAGASAAVRNYCGWHVAPVIEDDYTLDYEGLLLVLRSLRLVDVVSLSVAGTPVDVDAVKFSHNGEVALPVAEGWRGMPFPGAGFRDVQITIQHGFDLENAADLRQIVQQVVGNAISSPLGATREQAGQVAVSWATTAPGVSGGLSLLERDMKVLDRYKLP